MTGIQFFFCLMVYKVLWCNMQPSKPRTPGKPLFFEISALASFTQHTGFTQVSQHRLESTLCWSDTQSSSLVLLIAGPWHAKFLALNWYNQNQVFLFKIRSCLFSILLYMYILYMYMYTLPYKITQQWSQSNTMFLEYDSSMQHFSWFISLLLKIIGP